GLWWRVVRASLVVLSRTSLLVIATMVLFPESWPGAPNLGNPLRLVRVFTKYCLLPELAAWALGRIFSGTWAVTDGTLILERLRARVAIPCASIRRVVPWAVPIPGPGVAIQLASERWFPWGVQVADPAAF